MKFMEKAKRFFTLSAKHEGFTLVELIVVIAILAILAGVAVPAYSGYIKRAEKAGDLQLLAAVNDAFAAACMNEGTQISDIQGAVLAWTGKAVNGVEVVKGANLAEVQEAFVLFYGGNTGTEFKVLTKNDLGFVPGVGFVELANIPEGETYAVGYGGGIVLVSNGQVDALNNSNYLKEQTVGDLLNHVNAVAVFASDFDGDGYTNIMQSEGFLKSYAEVLGVPVSELVTKGEALAIASLKNKGIENPDPDQIAAEQDVVAANAMVMYAAKNASGLTLDEAKELLNGTNSSSISDNMQSKDADTNTTGLTQATLAYGMYYAYVNSDACSDKTLKDKEINILDVTSVLDDPNSEFNTKYMGTTQADGDMNALLSAMQMIDSTTQVNGNGAAVEDLIIKGFNNSELVGVFGGLVG